MHPLWQIKQVVTVHSKHYVERCNVFGGRASQHILLDSWIKQLESNVRQSIARLQSNGDIPGVQCQKLKGTNIGLTGSLARVNHNYT
jgi:hypothetical protein